MAQPAVEMGFVCGSGNEAGVLARGDGEPKLKPFVGRVLEHLGEVFIDQTLDFRPSAFLLDVFRERPPH